MKICDDHNGQINLHAKQKYEVLSATKSLSTSSRPSCKRTDGHDENKRRIFGVWQWLS